MLQYLEAFLKLVVFVLGVVSFQTKLHNIAVCTLEEVSFLIQQIGTVAYTQEVVSVIKSHSTVVYEISAVVVSLQI